MGSLLLGCSRRDTKNMFSVISYPMRQVRILYKGSDIIDKESSNSDSSQRMTWELFIQRILRSQKIIQSSKLCTTQSILWTELSSSKLFYLLLWPEMRACFSLVPSLLRLSYHPQGHTSQWPSCFLVFFKNTVVSETGHIFCLTIANNISVAF